VKMAIREAIAVVWSGVGIVGSKEKAPPPASGWTRSKGLHLVGSWQYKRNDKRFGVACQLLVEIAT
jgi:hypothetical protein